MFTVLKVRDELASYDEDPGWYPHPEGTVTRPASAEQLNRDGIDPQNPELVASRAERATPKKSRLARVNPIPPAAKAQLARWLPGAKGE